MKAPSNTLYLLLDTDNKVFVDGGGNSGQRGYSSRKQAQRRAERQSTYLGTNVEVVTVHAEETLGKSRGRDISVEQYCDGWKVVIKDDEYSVGWDHNDEDLGVHAIADMLEYLGHTVEIEEVY